MGKYFTVEVKPEIPTIATTGQHTTYGDADILFDWTSFDIPKGAAKLIGIVMEVRSQGDAGATVNKFGVDLLFGKSRAHGTIDPVSLGTSNVAVVATLVVPNIIGHVEMADTGYCTDLDGTAICTTGRTPQDACNIVLEGEPDSGTNVGYDKLWIGGIAKGAIDFTSLCRINNGTLDGSEFTVNGTETTITNDDFLYNRNPVTIILSFEK